MKIVTYNLKYTQDEWAKIKATASLEAKSIKQFIDEAIQEKIKNTQK